MPTPDRTSLDAIVEAARDLLEADGLPGVTMQAVALRVGVRAPSLYKRVRSREELIRLVAEATVAELSAHLRGTATLEQLLNAFRAFGRERPAAFQLIMAPGPGTPTAAPAVNEAGSEPLLRLTAQLAGEAHALEAARTLTAWATGFIGMELRGGFRLGGDVEAAWEFGMARLLAALAATPTAPPAHETRAPPSVGG